MSLQQVTLLAADLTPGTDIRDNHIACPSGTDTKKRLWVTLNTDGYASGYCHHCSGRWGHNTAPSNSKSVVLNRLKKFTTRLRDEEQAAGPGPELRIPLPKDIMHSNAGVPLEVRALFDRGHLSIPLRVRNHIGYSPTAERVIIPLMDAHTATYPVYVQYRKVLSTDNGPKYYSVKSMKKTDVCALFVGGKQVGVDQTFHKHSLILTEDVMSAIHASRFCPSRTVVMPLMGVTMSTTQLSFILEALPSLQSVILGLDNDNATVIAKTVKLFLQLRRLYTVYNLYLKQDVKEYEADVIRRILSNAHANMHHHHHARNLTKENNDGIDPRTYAS